MGLIHAEAEDAGEAASSSLCQLPMDIYILLHLILPHKHCGKLYQIPAPADLGKGRQKNN